MDKKFRIAGIAAAIAISVVIMSSPGAPPPLPDPTTTNQGNESVEVLASNLDKPRSLALADNRIFITEKSGRILVLENNTLLQKPLATFRVPDVFDGGLLGIQTHPDFANNHYLYIYHTYVQDGSLYNKITRITENKSQLVHAKTILDKIPGSPFSNGGVIKFGPDGHLYAATGSVSDSLHLAQDPDSLAGKILRLNDDGSIPDTNPIHDSAVYAMGFRNPQGMAWDAVGNFYMTDMGPTKSDEINLVLPGQNYGWPEQECAGKPYEDSILCYDPAIEPGGILVYDGDLLDIQGKLVMTALRASNLYTVDLQNPGLQTQDIILSGIGRIRDVAQAPDGSLYILTSNTDGKGFPTDDDDRLLRIVN